MPCGKHSMKWKNAMAIVRKEYPNLSVSRRKKIAGAIIGGKMARRRKKKR